MMGLSNEIRTVLLVGEESWTADLASHLSDTITLTGKPTTTSLGERIADSAVASVVVTDSVLDPTAEAVVRSIREQESDLPIVWVARDADTEPSPEVTGRYGTLYLPPETPLETIVDTVHDAVKRYNRHRTRRRNSTIFRSLFDQFPYSMFVKDDEARFLAATNVMPESDTLHGKTDLDWLANWDPDSARQTYQDDLDVIEHGKPIIKQEEEHRSRTGEGTTWSEATKLPWYGEDGEIHGLVGTALDITERKELERELERTKALHERIARYVAHDVRNPLNLAQGRLDLARETHASQEFDAVERALQRIEEIVTNMEIITGDDPAPPGPDNPPLSLRPIVTDAWETIESHDATVTVEVPESARIHADRSPLQEVFENLLRNAVEHGGPAVTIRVGTTSDGFFVADDGPGLPDPPDAVLQYGMTTSDSGSGIGLAITQEIANTYEWTVTARESEAGGARFDITDTNLIAHPEFDESTPLHRIPLDSNRDIGSSEPSGSAAPTDDSDSWRVTGGGRDIYYHTNEHHFAYAEIENDARISCRITELERAHEYSKAGVMIRAGLAESDPFGFVGMTADHGAEILWRPTQDGPTINDAFDETATLPQWVRLERQADVVTAAVSRDGTAWTPIDQRTVEGLETAYVGLAVCSHDASSRVDAKFDAVTPEQT